jgi:hypothetical protein
VLNIALSISFLETLKKYSLMKEKWLIGALNAGRVEDKKE